MRTAAEREAGRVEEMESARAADEEWSESKVASAGSEEGCLGWETGSGWGSDLGSGSAVVTEVLTERETVAAGEATDVATAAADSDWCAHKRGTSNSSCTPK